MDKNLFGYIYVCYLIYIYYITVWNIYTPIQHAINHNYKCTVFATNYYNTAFDKLAY